MPQEIATQEGERIFSVGEINGLSDKLLADEFPSIWIQGELGQISRPQSGHWYFSLKDEDAEISCVMFRSAAEKVARVPKQGDSLKVRGRLGIYRPRGGFQLRAERLEFSGEGELWQAFVQLREKLQGEGLFDEQRKRPIPEPPAHVALITSPSGAAVRDVLVVLRRRALGTRVTLIPAKVQGEGAAAELCRALDLAETLTPAADAVLLCRGGGSLEDLWAFNEEPLVRAVAGSGIPVVVAVGHESDTSLCDFAADLRAPTPSVGAEMLSQAQYRQPERLQRLEDGLAVAARAALERAGQRLDEGERGVRRHFAELTAGLRNRLERLQAAMRHPSAQVQVQREKLEQLETRLQPLAQAQLARARSRADQAEKAGAAALQALLARLGAQLGQHDTALQALSPLRVLDRGYAMVLDGKQRLVTDAAGLAPGDALQIRLARGEADAQVTATRPHAQKRQPPKTAPLQPTARDARRPAPQPTPGADNSDASEQGDLF